MLALTIWEALPGRASRSAPATASTVARAIDADEREVLRQLHAMERTGAAIRDRNTGHRADNWHRGVRPTIHLDHDTDDEPEGAGLWD